jgi:hypothetical protein
LIAIILPFILDHFPDLAANLLHVDIKNSRWAQPGFWYQELTLAGYRHPRAHFVRLVTSDPEKEEPTLQGNACLTRAFEADLLIALLKIHPALIVLDEYFPQEMCPSNDPGTAKLKAAITPVTAAGIPVIIGRYSISREDQLEATTPPNMLLDDDEVYLKPSVNFQAGDPSRSLVSYGVTTIESDSRLIPLSWPTYPSEADFGAHRSRSPQPTLPLQVAKVYGSSPLFQWKLGMLAARDRDPYTSFLNMGDFIKFEALDIICGGARTPRTTQWESCAPSDYGIEDLRGHIVLVGDEDDGPFDSVVGQVPGYLLQANYMEGLLDDRVFSPVSPWITVSASLLLFAAIESMFRLYRSRPIKAVVLAFCSIALAWLVCYVLVLAFGYYLSLWVPGVIVVLGEFISLLLERRSPDLGQKNHLRIW